MTIKEFMNEHNFSLKAIKFLYSEAKRQRRLEFFDITVFVDSNMIHGMKYIYNINFVHNQVTLMKEDEYANYSLFEKYDDF